MLFAHSHQHLLYLYLMDLSQAPKEIQALLVFLGEMVSLVFQDNLVSPVLLVLLESVNHVPLLVRTFLLNLIHMMSRLEEEEV